MTDEGVSEREADLRRRLLDLLASRPLTRAELARALNTEVAEVERILDSLRAEGLVELSGLERGGDFGIALPRWRLRDTAQ